MEDKLKSILRYIVSLSAAALLLAVSFRHLEWGDFTAALAGCRWYYVILSMAIGALSLWFRALRWRMLLNPIDPSIRAGVCFNSVGIGMLANLVLPRAGEFVRCGYVAAASARKEDGSRMASYDKVIGTVVLERAWDMLSLLICLVVVAVCTWNRFGDFFMDNVIGRIAGSASVPWLLVIMAAAALALLCLVWAFRDKSGVCARIWKTVAGIWQGVASCLHMKSGWMFIVLTAGIWSCYLMTAATVIWAVQGSGSWTGTMNMTDALFLMTVGSVSSLVPVPGGFGAYHYLVSLALQSVYAMPKAVSLAFATLSHESQAIMQMLCGLFGWVRESLRK